MLNTECKQCHKKWHNTNAKYCSMCGKKLVEEPEFKVGDCVVLKTESEKVILKIEKMSIFDEFSYDVSGSSYWESNDDFCFWSSDGYLMPFDMVRHATPEEISEYEAALNFHKHGRKPFDVKDGDLLEDIMGKFFADHTYYDKEDFIVGKCKLLKTAEEVNEWLGIADE